MKVEEIGDLMPLSQIASQLKSRPHVATLARWTTRGIRGVRLESCLVGGRRCTSLQAVRRFIASTSAAAKSPLQQQAITSSKSVRTRRQRAAKDLDSRGM